MCPKRKSRKCNHNNIKHYWTGGFRFAGGEVWDDIKEVSFCLDCGRAVRKNRKPANLFGRSGKCLGAKNFVGGGLEAIPF
jgi:hypothetical protein